MGSPIKIKLYYTDYQYSTMIWKYMFTHCSQIIYHKHDNLNYDVMKENVIKRIK